MRGALLPIEVKLGVGVPDLRGIATCMHDLGLARGYVVSLVPEPLEIRRGIWMGGLRELLEELRLAPAIPTQAEAPIRVICPTARASSSCWTSEPPESCASIQ